MDRCNADRIAFPYFRKHINQKAQGRYWNDYLMPRALIVNDLDLLDFGSGFQLRGQRLAAVASERGAITGDLFSVSPPN